MRKQATFANPEDGWVINATTDDASAPVAIADIAVAAMSSWPLSLMLAMPALVPLSLLLLQLLLLLMVSMVSLMLLMDTVVDAVAGTGVDTATTMVSTAVVASTEMAFATTAMMI